MPSDSYTLIISDVGVSTPSTGSVTNASVASNAAIAFSKLATLTSGNVLVGNSSNVATSVALSGNVTVSNTGVATIANDAVTFAKMQNVAGYSILGKPTSGSGDAAEIGSSSFMLEASTGFLRQTDATSARSTLGIADAATGNALLSGGVGTAPAYGKVGLTTHVDGVLPVANGGSGLTSYAIGDIPYASGATTLSKLSDIATGNALLSGGIGAAPVYGKVGLTTHVVDTLPIANGGTGLTSYSVGDIPYASGSTTLSKLAGVATGNALLSGGLGTAPAYGKVGLTTHVDGTLPAANGGTGYASYAVGDIIYASGTTALSKLADVATGNVLRSGGVGVAPAYGKVGLTTHVDGVLAVANGGTGSSTATGTGLPVLQTSPSLITPILGTPTSGTLTSCTGLPLTTGVTGTLAVANGGTGVTQSAYGSYYISSSAATTIVTSGNYVKVAGTTTSDNLSNFTHSTSNRLTYTGTATRKFALTAALSFHGTNSNDYNFAFYKNSTTQLTASIVATTATGTGNLAHVSSQCLVELANTDFIELFVTNVDGTGSATVDFMNVAVIPLI